MGRKLSLPIGEVFKFNDGFVVLIPYDHVEGTFPAPCFGYASPLLAQTHHTKSENRGHGSRVGYVRVLRHN